MQTIQFQCGHCGKLMAVSGEVLGQQVRCPHCQQVVVAPPPTPAAPPAWNPEAEDRESIFTEHYDEDIFGAGPRHVVEMPPEPLRPTPPPEPVAFELPAAPPDQAPAVPVAEEGPGGLMSPELDHPANPDAAPAAENFWQDSAAAGPQDSVQPEALATTGQLLVKPTRSGGYAVTLVLILLVPYAIFMTLIAVFLYVKSAPGKGSGSSPSGAHPLEMLPDEGLNPGTRRVLQKRLSGEGKEAELPPQLRVALGKTLRIGDLEVTPRNIAMRWITVNTTGYNPNREKALVLKLHLKNVSANAAFHPVDPFFDRSWKEGDPNGKPYTSLVMGGKRFYGGPIDWNAALSRARQYIPEQDQGRELKPGEEMDTIICTNQRDEVENDLEAYHGPLVWRVQLRRGFVAVRGRDASATAVVGVEFKDSDVAWELKDGEP